MTLDPTTPNVPHVSAIMIFLNAEKYMDEAIRSVLAQTYSRWELLLVDDGSNDGSTEIAREYARRYPERIRYLEHADHANLGMSAARNLGIRHAIGEYIAFLDADDVWLPSKLDRQVAILEAHPSVAMVFGRTEYWHSWTGLLDDLRHDHVPELGVPVDTAFEPPTLLTLLHPLGTGPAPCMCSLLVRTDAVRKVGGFEESFRGSYEDQAFLTKVYLTETVFASGECLDRYRVHPESCCSIVNQTGGYEYHRERFLRWTDGYLRTRGVTDPTVWTALDDALQQYEDAHRSRQSEYKWRRLLRVAEGNQARLVFPSDNPDMVRIEITGAGTEPIYDIQMNKPRLSVQANHRYVLSFLARADSPREISFGFALGHSPWTNLGCYREIELTTEWQPFEAEFTATDDEDNARIHFDVGKRGISVDLSAVTLRSLSEGRFVKPPAPPPRAGETVVEPSVRVGSVEFGSFRRVTPISDDFGVDRGLPIDRYYIENFLAARKDDVRGRVLEVGENTYTYRYGDDRVTISDVLHVVEGHPKATIIADLASADHIPSNTFDCIILTQTLQLIYEIRGAIETIYRILKPSGVLLATFPGLSQTYDIEWGETWFWNLTPAAARRLFGEVFPEPNLTVETFGNVLTTISFLHGLAVDELLPEELDYREPGYDVTVTVRARKPDPEVDEADRVRGAVGHREQPSPPKALVLMYHRVTSGVSDPWSMCVTPKHFSEQLNVVRQHANPMRLQDLVGSLATGDLADRAVVVTFDDGYADNLHNAKPLLGRLGIPATLFVTTSYIGTNREFWWDELDRVLLQPGTLPERLEFSVRGTRHEWALGEASTYTEEAWHRNLSWKASERPPSARHEVFLAVWELLQPLYEGERQAALTELRAWASTGTEARPTHRVLTVQELTELARDGLIELGSHTETHPLLPELPASSQRAEIDRGGEAIRQMLGRAPASFAYPYGAYSPETASIARESGVTCACSTNETYVSPTSDPYQLPRFEVRDWNGEEFERRLKEWLG